MSDYNRSRLLLAVKKFNEKDYFECHEILEEIWFDVRDDSRDFYHGLLHAAVGFYHYTKKKNHKGTILQLEKALNRLGKFGGEYDGIDLEKLTKEIKRFIIRLNKKEQPKRLPLIKIR